MKTEFEIKMTTGSMYRFFMYHAYHGFAGIFSIIAGAGLIGFYFANLKNNVSNVWIYLVFPYNPTYEMLLIVYPITWVMTSLAMFVAYMVTSRHAVRKIEKPSAIAV